MADNSHVLLALDTSTESAGLAIYDGARISELVWNAGRNQTLTLLGQLTHLLEINGRELDEIGAIAVATGPGTFNGLRVGMSTAKGLAYGRDIPLLGVDTLEITAYPHRSSSRPVRAFVPAGRGRTVFSDYRKRNNRWVRDGEMHNRPFPELASGIAELTLLTGEAPSGYALEDLESDLVEIPRLALRSRRPGCLAEIAWRRWMAGERDDIAGMEPAYVHSARGTS
ncbi:MAG: tRNA (adenosine(37)-N6)-threonylcarbamoyltransferase complex dimerization subunit type 1 TsaB [Thermomicrobiaceae bacterium]